MTVIHGAVHLNHPEYAERVVERCWNVMDSHSSVYLKCPGCDDPEQECGQQEVGLSLNLMTDHGSVHLSSSGCHDLWKECGSEDV